MVSERLGPQAGAQLLPKSMKLPVWLEGSRQGPYVLGQRLSLG